MTARALRKGDLAIALDRLRAHAGVVDVLQQPAIGKKGRMCAQIQILAAPDNLDSVFEACFAETTTLGLRWQLMERRVLRRAYDAVEVAGRNVRVKSAERSSGFSAKAESDDLLSIEGGRLERESIRRAAEHAVLNGDKS